MQPALAPQNRATPAQRPIAEPARRASKLARNLSAPIAVVHDQDAGDVSHLRAIGLRPFRFLCSGHSRETLAGIECGRVEHFRHLTLTVWADCERNARAHLVRQLTRFCPAVKSWAVLPA